MVRVVIGYWNRKGCTDRALICRTHFPASDDLTGMKGGGNYDQYYCPWLISIAGVECLVPHPGNGSLIPPQQGICDGFGFFPVAHRCSRHSEQNS